MNYLDFKELIKQKSTLLYRTMPWREDTRAYYILVSELMLQQTQVDRVIPKFLAFIDRFPNETTLAEASLSDVLALWNGLGYNRRAKYLHDAAKKVVSDFGGEFPETRDELLTLPGVGPGTAGAICAYAFNQPVVYIETNVRTVYFHHFFHDDTSVSDKQIADILEKTIDKKHPREFYWTLMDYGTVLKKQGSGKIQKSTHYKKQSALKGSVREIRGKIIAALVANGSMSQQAIAKAVDVDERFVPALCGLIRDGLVSGDEANLYLTK